MLLFAVISILFALKASFVHNAAIMEEMSSCTQQSSEYNESSFSSFASEGINNIESSFSAASSSLQEAAKSSFSSIQSGLGSVTESSGSNSMQQALSSATDIRSTISNAMDLSNGLNLAENFNLAKDMDLSNGLDLSDKLNLVNGLDLTEGLGIAKGMDLSNNLNLGNGLDLASLTNSLQQNSFLPSTDVNYYISQLQNLEKKKLEFIQGMFGMMKGQAPCLNQEILGEVQQKMQSVYDLMQSNNLLTSGADLSSKVEVLNQAKAQLQEVVSKLQETCPVGKALKCAMEQDDSLLPLVCGLANGIFKQQSSYYSNSTSVSS